MNVRFSLPVSLSISLSLFVCLSVYLSLISSSNRMLSQTCGNPSNCNLFPDILFFIYFLLVFVCLFVCLNIYESSILFIFPRFGNLEPGSYQLSVSIFQFTRFGNPKPGCCQCQLSMSFSKVLVIQRPGIPSGRAG